MPKKAAEGTSFLERSDLVKINKCYHRFHLFCLCHFWFDQLEDDFDDKGNVMFEYIPPKDKLCPVCRREVGSMDYARLILKNKQPFALSEINENIKKSIHSVYYFSFCFFCWNLISFLKKLAHLSSSSEFAATSMSSST